MNINEEFLKNFNVLEEELVIISGLKGEFVSFSRALDKVHYSRLNRVVKDKNVYQFLRTASDIRNILSHETNACVPSEQFNKKFTALVEEICDPLIAYDIATKTNKMLIARMHYPVKNVVKEMVIRKLSHVPVIENHHVIGVFSRSTFFEFYANHDKIDVNGNCFISDFVEETPVEKHGNESYVFTARDTEAYELLDLIGKGKAGQKRVNCIFVTEHGKSSERLLGVITEVDLLKLPVYDRKKNM